MEKRRKNRKYDRHFKEEAVKLGVERGNLSSVARELGLDPKMLRRWKLEYEEFKEGSFQGSGTSRMTDIQKENQRLKKENYKQKMELEILKKALDIISASDR
ncbi:MAG: transposase [Bacteroidales bacterium]|nr:transposase [Bacteroidales bacterium]